MPEARSSAERTIPGLTPLLKRRLHALFRVLTALSPALAARLAMRLFTRPRPRPIEPEDLAFLSELVPAAHSEEVAGSLKAGRLQMFPTLSHGEPLRDPRTAALVADFIADHLDSCRG